MSKRNLGEVGFMALFGEEMEIIRRPDRKGFNYFSADIPSSFSAMRTIEDRKRASFSLP
jgi:hypothetical protein